MQTPTCLRHFCVALLLSITVQPAFAFHPASDSIAPVPSPATVLDILYCSSKEFLAINGRKTVFKYMVSSGDLVMAGWHVKGAMGHEFPDSPGIVLQKSHIKDTTTWGAKTYIGNVILRKGDISNIKKQIKTDTSMKYVLFVPKPDTDYPNHVVYEVMLCASNISAEKEWTASLSYAATGVKANPSPPRQYSKL